MAIIYNAGEIMRIHGRLSGHRKIHLYLFVVSFIFSLKYSNI